MSLPKLPSLLSGYRLIKILGKGSHGSVYQAIDTEKNENVAIKIISYERMNSDEKRMLVNEVNLLRDICTKCSQTVKYLIHIIDKSESLIYIVTELLEIVDFEINKQFLLLYLFGLKCIHDNGIVHGDIKPDNILFTTHGVKFIDFGMAHTDMEVKMYSSYGTPYYMSPEKFMHRIRNFDDAKRNDVWSLGVTLYFLFNDKQYPWKTGLDFQNAMDTAIYSHTNLFHEIIQPSKTGTDIDIIINKMLVVNPDKRPTIDELLSMIITGKSDG